MLILIHLLSSCAPWARSDILLPCLAAVYVFLSFDSLPVLLCSLSQVGCSVSVPCIFFFTFDSRIALLCSLNQFSVSVYEPCVFLLIIIHLLSSKPVLFELGCYRSLSLFLVLPSLFFLCARTCAPWAVLSFFAICLLSFVFFLALSVLLVFYRGTCAHGQAPTARHHGRQASQRPGTTAARYHSD